MSANEPGALATGVLRSLTLPARQIRGYPCHPYYPWHPWFLLRPAPLASLTAGGHRPPKPRYPIMTRASRHASFRVRVERLEDRTVPSFLPGNEFAIDQLSGVAKFGD